MSQYSPSSAVESIVSEAGYVSSTSSEEAKIVEDGMAAPAGNNGNMPQG